MVPCPGWGQDGPERSSPQSVIRSGPSRESGGTSTPEAAGRRQLDDLDPRRRTQAPRPGARGVLERCLLRAQCGMLTPGAMGSTSLEEWCLSWRIVWRATFISALHSLTSPVFRLRS